MTINRELSQFASFVSVNDATKNIGIATTGTPNIGIGTANPSVKFEVVGNTKLQSLNVTGITTLGVTSTTDLTSQTLTVSGITTLGVTSTTNLTSQTLTVSGITTVGVLTATSIGIGTTNPTAKLDVRGDVTVSGLTSTASLTVTGPSALFKQGIDVTGTATVDGLTVLPGPSNLNGQTNLYNALNVSGITTLASDGGITTTGGNLYVGDNLYVDNTIFTSVINSPNAIVYFENAGIFVDNDGIFDSNLGIGTTNPTSKLHVVGSSLITGISTVGLGTTSTPPSNSQMSFELTTDTNLVIKVRGTDGLLRSANITLA